MTDTKTGRVKRIITDRGFGFIRDDETHEDLFFHATELVNEKFENLEVGAQVSFIAGNRKGRTCCLDVVVQNNPD